MGICKAVAEGMEPDATVEEERTVEVDEVWSTVNTEESEPATEVTTISNFSTQAEREAI